MLINSLCLSFSLPQNKVESIVKLCNDILTDKNGRVKLRDLAKIMGNFSWAIPSVPFAQGHFRKLQNFYLSHAHRDLNKMVSLTEPAKADLVWWATHLKLCNGKSFFPENPDLIIFSDASLTGWGAVCDGSRSRGPWTTADAERHINELELLAAYFSLQAFANSSKNISIQLFLDNSAAVAYINKCGGTHSKALSILAAQIIHWCEARNIQILASHLPGNSNIIADEESRAAPDSSDWMLLQDRFRQLSKIWPVQTDLFASAWNAQLPNFVSWLPQPKALAINAFALNWQGLIGYAFPPFALIPRCLAKIKKEKADIVLVGPLWPSQPWFPLLLQMSIDIPRILSPHHLLLHSPTLEPHPLIKSKKFLLVAWKLSGDALKIKDFQKELSTFSWKVSVSPHQLVTNPRGKIGLIGTTKGSDPLSSSLIIILQFLTDIANSGSSYSSVNTSRSMLSSTLDPIDGYKIGEHPTVIQLLKGCFNRKPPKARYNSLWDPDVVLNYLNSLPNNSDLGVAVLSKKLATLLALATIYRVSEIVAISFHSLKFSQTAASFSLTRPKKAQHSGPLKSFVLPRFKGKCCPVECLECYVAISGEWRDPDSSALFLSIRRPHKPVGSSTLGNWIKSCLSDAGLKPSSFSAHSTRGAAASKAVKQGIPVDTVLKTANWSRESTFQKFYHRELVGTTVTEAVLTQISSE